MLSVQLTVYFWFVSLPAQGRTPPPAFSKLDVAIMVSFVLRNMTVAFRLML